MERNRPEQVHSVHAHMHLHRLLKGKTSLYSWSEKVRCYISMAQTGLLECSGGVRGDSVGKVSLPPNTAA